MLSPGHWHYGDVSFNRVYEQVLLNWENVKTKTIPTMYFSFDSKSFALPKDQCNASSYISKNLLHMDQAFKTF